MTHLIIVSGPSGVGKNTLIDRVRQAQGIDYFKKVTTRIRRPDDRDEETDFISGEEYEQMHALCKIALPYTIRENRYGIPVTSLAKLKDKPVICALGDFNLITSLKKSFHTTTVYVTADQQKIIARLKAREDTPEQRQKSIDSVSLHLAAYYTTHRNLFDHEIDNGEDLARAQQELVDIVREETEDLLFTYDFLHAASGCSQETAQEELDREARDYWRITEAMTALPNKWDLHQILSESMQKTHTTATTLFVHHTTYIYGNAVIHLDSKVDRERRNISYGKISIFGMRRDITQARKVIENKLPSLKEYRHSSSYTHCRPARHIHHT